MEATTYMNLELSYDFLVSFRFLGGNAVNARDFNGSRLKMHRNFRDSSRL